MPADCASCSKPNATATCGACKCTYYCGPKCQRKDWKKHKKLCKSLRTKSIPKHIPSKQVSNDDDHKADALSPLKQIPKLFRIEPIKNKGLGIIANRDIAAGTLILSETPLLSLVTGPNLDIRSLDMDHLAAHYAKPLLQRYNALTTKQQRIFNGLSHKHDGSVIDKFLNNALTEESTGFDGVYPLISRLNHSCTANCIHWIQPQSDSNVQLSARIIALYDIPKHSELTINYLGWNPLTFKERAHRLETGWNIGHCDCGWCAVKERKRRDQWIVEYRKLDAVIPEIKDFGRKYRECRKMVKLVRERFDCNPQLMYRHCWDLAQSALPAMQLDVFEEYLVNTVKYKWMAHGKDTEIPQEVQEMLQQIGMMKPEMKQRILSKIKKL